jgi:LysM repeat protein
MRKALVVVLLVVIALSFATPVAACGPGVHIVRYGETLFSIGRWYGVSPWAIARANGLVNPNFIYAGQRLTIPGRCGWHYGWGCGGYVVRHGDTLYSIAWRHGVNMYTLARVNGITNLNRIYAGQCLTIP